VEHDDCICIVAGWFTSVVKEFAPTAQIWAGEDGPIGGGNDGTLRCSVLFSVHHIVYATTRNFASAVAANVLLYMSVPCACTYYTGSCGGNRSICTTYASALTYADDLGLRAKHGFSQYQRQAFFGGSYGLTDTKAKHPQSALGADEPLLLRPGYCARITTPCSFPSSSTVVQPT
jgi:hypothetical protein